MKTYRKLIYLIICFTCFFMYSCEKYLDKTIKADVTENMVFTTFPTFQGFIERLYYDVIDFAVTPRSGTAWNYGDDILGDFFNTLIDGNYWAVAGDYGNTQYDCKLSPARGCQAGGAASRRSIWGNGWAAIRDANTALVHLKDMVDVTSEERNVIEGQAYFFRGYMHWQIIKQWGNIPYCDTLFRPADYMKIPQLSLYATAEKVLADFQKAVDLLPVDWDETVVGQPTKGINRGRLTKGMALAFIAEVQMWCGSPLFNGTMTGDFIYNIDYCKKAAASAWKVIELANQGVYALDSWTDFNSLTNNNLFRGSNNREPARSKELIFKSPFNRDADERWHITALVLPAVGGGGMYLAPTQNYVELFEMNNGVPIDDPLSTFNPTDPWSNRDPRLLNSITVDQDRIVENRNDKLAFAQFYSGGRDRVGASQTAFGMKKFLVTTWNRYDNKWGNQGFLCVPILRLAEIYLFYAEAANEAYGGPSGKDPDANLTALDAVNIVRNRAGMPGVNSKFHNQTDFRARVWNERAVELAFEAKRRDDLRRWHVAHLNKYKDLYSCEFPIDHSIFQKKYIRSIVFEEKHYWFPYPSKQVLLYPEWKQNPGW